METNLRILILYSHPLEHLSRVNRRMAEAARSLPHVRIHNLYETYPDFYIDVAQEQVLLEQVDLVVFQHPILWYSMPALLKEWMDVVLIRGWAYGEGGTAMKGKDFWLAATTSGDEAPYHGHGGPEQDFSVFLPLFEQTALACGMRWLPPFILAQAHRADDTVVNAHVEAYRQRLASYPHWTTQAE